MEILPVAISAPELTPLKFPLDQLLHIRPGSVQVIFVGDLDTLLPAYWCTVFIGCAKVITKEKG